MNLFNGKEVIVGTPSAHQDKHRHQPNGDSMIAIQRARHEYEEDQRRRRPREFVEKIFEWVLIIVAVFGFGVMILLNFADLFSKYGLVVPVSIIVAVMAVFFANRKRG